MGFPLIPSTERAGIVPTLRGYFSLIPTKPNKAKMTEVFGNFLIFFSFPTPQKNQKLPNRAGDFFSLASTDNSEFCQLQKPISSFRGIILTIFKNAKNGRKKTGNLFLISCFGMPFCMYGGYSVLGRLFIKTELEQGSDKT